jgi:hypothetical protein
MVFLGDKAQVDARFELFGDRANLDTCLIEHLGDVAHVESHIGPFGDGVSIGAR